MLHIHLLSLLGLNTAGATSMVLLLSTRVLLSIKAAEAVVNLITLWLTGEVNY